MDVKYIAGSTIGYTLPRNTKEGYTPRRYEITDFNLMIKSLLPNKVKVKIEIDDTRLSSNLTKIKTIRFTSKSFFYSILGFTQSHSGPFGNIERLFQLIPGTYKSEKLI